LFLRKVNPRVSDESRKSLPSDPQAVLALPHYLNASGTRLPIDIEIKRIWNAYHTGDF
jgi:hypothetical protein